MIIVTHFMFKQMLQTKQLLVFCHKEQTMERNIPLLIGVANFVLENSIGQQECLAIEYCLSQKSI